MNKNKIMKTIIFIAVLLIPVIYSFFYLKSYWDPYGNLQDLNVAVVNRDTGEDRSKSRKRIDRLIN
jgi:putative membrane protein